MVLRQLRDRGDRRGDDLELGVRHRDRVKLTMSGKFLPYRYHGNEPEIADHGVKEP